MVAREFDCIEFNLITRRAFFCVNSFLRVYGERIVGRDVVRPCFMYSDYCVCTTCQLGTSCLRCTFVKYCKSVAGARIAICFVHVILFMHVWQSVITLMLYLFMFYNLLILFTCVNTYIFLHKCFWLTFNCVPLIDYPHKSHSDLGLDPSSVVVKFSRAYPWFSISIPFPSGGLRDLRVQQTAVPRRQTATY
jgi:hypothetical protein